MFPPGQSDDPFPFHYNPYQEHSNIQQDQILQGQALLERNINSSKMGKGQQHKLLFVATTKVNDGNSDNNNNKKMILRKDIERQRRQHLSMLHASLRSLLPLQSIKGKRSISDHINEARNYINYLNKNIQELGLKRDKLKNLSELGAVGHGSLNWDNCLQNCVTIHPYSGGVEIVINSVHKEENLKLSKVMEAVLEEGLDVIRCASTQTDEGFFHTIQAELKLDHSIK
ncbi:hypothetical protein WN943_027890 [Citrus x changshan-huyou]